MNFLRNPEIKKTVLIQLMVALFSACIGFFINFQSGLLTIFISIVFITIHLITTYLRYEKITALSKEIDEVLHGKEHLEFLEYNEGELAILQNEIKKMTTRLREQTDALKKEKSYLSDSIADISHQLRTPLTSMNLLISFLSKPDITQERKLKLIKDLNKLTGRIDWLISALLKISKIDAGTANFKKEMVVLKEAIEKAYAALAIPMELREQEFILECTGKETMVGDLAWSVEAIGNIIKNCMEHTPMGGRILVSCLQNAIYSEIVVADNGEGIEKEDLPHLFERFYRGKNSSEHSVGIGLALARMIIMEQNGTIKAENNSDTGAKFTIRFYNSII